jgi:hypothetical protein
MTNTRLLLFRCDLLAAATNVGRFDVERRG